MSHVTRPDDSVCALSNRECEMVAPGLTKREWFAALAMQGVISGLADKARLSMDEVALASVNYADALIAELNK